MENSLLKYTELCLGTLEPLQPRPTGERHRVRSLDGIRAVLFDVYGTLLISASGDVDISDFSLPGVLTCLEDCAVRPLNGNPRVLAQRAVTEFKHTITRMHERDRQRGIAYPEVDIVEVWQEALRALRQYTAGGNTGTVDYEKLAFSFEMTNNPVYPMPGMNDMLRSLQARGVPLGIISNAQFFTPLLLNYFISGMVSRSATVDPFLPELTIMSYQHRRAKPDPFLFNLAKRELATRGLRPDNVLFVGNDMLNDVYGASRTGFKTVLFAGDTRSLRWRQDHPLTRGLEPDCVITELSQLDAIVGEGT